MANKDIIIKFEETVQNCEYCYACLFLEGLGN